MGVLIKSSSPQRKRMHALPSHPREPVHIHTQPLHSMTSVLAKIFSDPDHSAKGVAARQIADSAALSFGGGPEVGDEVVELADVRVRGEFEPERGRRGGAW